LVVNKEKMYESELLVIAHYKHTFRPISYFYTFIMNFFSINNENLRNKTLYFISQ
jgi:hypothetical protein